MQIHDQSRLHGSLLLVSLLILGGCTGSSSSNTVQDGASGNTPANNNNGTLAQSEPNTSAEVGVAAVSTASINRDEPADSVQTRTLINDFDTRCIVVGRAFSLTVKERITPADGSADEVFNVSAYASLYQSNSSSVELVSRTDEMLNLVMTKQDIASVTTTLDSTSVTAYIGAFNEDAPATAVLRKPIPGGCFYALRLDGDRFCGANVAKSTTVGIKSGDEGISMNGCELDNPFGYPVFDIPAE